MANIKSRLKLRSGTSAAWSTADPVLLAGEPGFETDTGRLRIGDGVNRFTSLPYIQLNTTGYQAVSTVLTSLAGLGSAANKGIYFSDINTLSEFDLTAPARTFLGGANQAALRSALGLFTLSNLDPALIRTAIETMALDLTDDDELPTVKAVADFVNARLAGWTAVASKNRAVDFSLTDLTATLKANYAYRIEGRFVSKTDTSGVTIRFNSNLYSLVVPLGVAANTYNFQVEFENYDRSAKVLAFKGGVAVSGSNIQSGTALAWVLGTGAFPNNVSEYPFLNDIIIPFDATQNWDGSGHITIYEKPIR